MTHQSICIPGTVRSKGEVFFFFRFFFFSSPVRQKQQDRHQASGFGSLSKTQRSSQTPVSYTHLDVYKRQEFDGNAESRYLPSVVIGVLKIAMTSE